MTCFRHAFVFFFLVSLGFHVWANGNSGFVGIGYDIEEQGVDGDVFYVSPTGDDAAVGSELEPFRTIEKGASVLGPGDTLLLRGGEYTSEGGWATVEVNARGTAQNWIKIANYPGERPVLRFSNARGFALKGVEYFVMEGIEIDGLSDLLDPVAATDFADSFDGTDYSNTSYFGVGIRIEGDSEASAPHHVIVRGCRIYNCPGGGISTALADYVLIEKNVISGCAFYSPWGESGISIWESLNHDDRTDVYRTVVTDNVCYGNDNKVKFWIMGAFSDGNGIILDALRVDQGIVDGIETEPYSGRVLVANNICYDNGGRGVNVYESDRIDVVNNTLYRNARRDGVQNEIELGRTKGTRIHNNIIVAHDDRNAIGGYQYEEIVVDWNLFFNSRAMSIDTGDFAIFTEPRFADVPTDVSGIAFDALDFRLAADSPAIGSAGGELLSQIDRRGQDRGVGGSSELGAYEYLDPIADLDPMAKLGVWDAMDWAIGERVSVIVSLGGDYGLYVEGSSDLGHWQVLPADVDYESDSVVISVDDLQQSSFLRLGIVGD